VLSLYLHIPFCRRKCPYCDFYSVENGGRLLDEYPSLLIRHMERSAERNLWSGPCDTLFFGGGTPSLLAPEAIGSLLRRVQEAFGFSEKAEITLEANPGTVSSSSLDGYRARGVNRISFGIQSLNQVNLTSLGRLHSPGDARRSIEWAHKAGFENVSADLMFGLPGQKTSDFMGEVSELLSLGVKHLSLYGLTIEENTPFYHLHRKGDLPLPEEDTFREMYLALHDHLEKEGLVHYEISNFARPGYECRHNLNYWRRGGYLGVGAGAHGFTSEDWGARFSVPADLQTYERTLAAGEDPEVLLETFDRRGAMSETLYLGLRMREGIREKAFRRRFGAGVAESFPREISRLADYLVLREGRWRMEVSGWLIYDHIISEFL